MKKLVFLVVLAAVAASPLRGVAAEPTLRTDAGAPSLDVDTRLPMGPIILTSFSLCFVAVGAGFGWQADQEYDDWKTAQKAGDGATMDTVADDVHKHSVAANVLMIGGGALAVTGIIWWIAAARADRRKGEAAGEQTARWRPLLGPGQASLLVEF